MVNEISYNSKMWGMVWDHDELERVWSYHRIVIINAHLKHPRTTFDYSVTGGIIVIQFSVESAAKQPYYV